MRRRQFLTVIAFVFLISCTYFALRVSQDGATFVAALESAAYTLPDPADESQQQPVVWEDLPRPLGGPKPKRVPGTDAHPIWFLVNEARREFEEMKIKQSKTLKEGVQQYHRRYSMSPPPHFDKWFEFAKENDVQLVDEFDSIQHLLTPFWGLRPKTIRARAQEALGFDNALLGISIRDHKVTNIQGGQDWQRNATIGMMAKFLRYLPDMDLAFNIHDEPRVMVPHDDLARLVQKARSQTMPAATSNKKPYNDFSQPPADLDDGIFLKETKSTRFNVYAHQPTWTHSRMSCPPDSPSRSLEEDRADDLSKYGLGELGFVYNTTAMTDICLSPSLSATYGFFDRPNAYNVVHDLFPIFSQSKISSYNDIIYPSPWYWYEQVRYDASKDRSWADKEDKLYWRGSTTGGFSRNGGWRRHHRQQVVKKINAGDQAMIMRNPGGDEQPHWEVQEVPRGNYRDLVDVQFTHVGQCDPGDCAAQKQFFNVKDHAEQQDAWRYKYLLDMDGNAFSGRFFAFLHSLSLIFKYALFREWHNEWLKPWVHYVPLSLQGDDWLEAVRFFDKDGWGRAEAERIAATSSDWAQKALRKEDMEAWFFRLLLEYGRVIDDQRDVIGYHPESANKKLNRSAPPPPQTTSLP